MGTALGFALAGALLLWIPAWVAGRPARAAAEVVDRPGGPPPLRLGCLLWSMASALLFAIALWFLLEAWGWVSP